MGQHNIAIIGSGSLARAICYALASTCTAPVAVSVISRSAINAEELCYVANTRAALGHTSACFAVKPVDAYSCSRLGDALTECHPEIVLNCASLQSPWEKTSAPSAWTDLVHRAGFGVTLPLQARIPIEVATAIAAQPAPPLFLNASFPDAVNPVLAALGLPVFSGIGNVALLLASISSALKPRRGARLQVLGHHWHLYPPQPNLPEACAWLDGVRLEGVGEMLRKQRSANRSELNHVNGLATARLLEALASARELRTSLPGPLGLAGGYPVRISGRQIELDLPPGLSRAHAIEMNSIWAASDGVQVTEDGEIVFAEQCCDSMRSEWPEFCGRLRARDIVEAGARLSELREELRRRPASFV